MILDLTIIYALTDESVSRIVCDNLPSRSINSFKDAIEELDNLNREEVCRLAEKHLSKFGKLGIPNDSQLANKFGITEPEAAKLVSYISERLKKL